MKTKSLQIYDTTLRDGAQGEGVSFSGSAKLWLAKRLDALGVAYIEGGYAGSNEKDMAFFREIGREDLTCSKVVAFGSTRRAKVKVNDDPMLSSLLEAATSVVTIVGKTWDLHVRDVLGASGRENLAMISDTVNFLKNAGKEVIFDAEHFFDGYKRNPEYAVACLSAADRAGVDTIVLCDTNGGSLPHEVGQIVGEMKKHTGVALGFHAHNDTGVAVANTIEAVRAGAVQLHCTVNGYGERCGNTDFCSLVPTLELKMGYRCLKKGALKGLRDLSLSASDMVNVRPDKKAPYVGQSAFSHKGGPHVNAVKKNPCTYEHIRPEKVGNQRRVLVSELSGGSSVLVKAIELGLGRKESAEGAREILKELKRLESKGYAYEAADASFRLLIQKVLKKHKPFFGLEGFRVIVEKRGKNEPCLSEATVKVNVAGEVEQTVAEGDGPVNALDSALRKALGRFYPGIDKVALTDFHVSILDPQEATAATTRVLIESGDGEDTWRTIGVSENIIEASWQALLDSVEYKLFREEEKAAKGARKAKKVKKTRKQA